MRGDSLHPERIHNPDTTLAWAFRPNFGIVHPMNCAICRSYVAHMVVANQSNDQSFKDALSEREVRLSSAFLDGVREGRQLQEEHDMALLTRYREERDQAVQNLDRHKQMLDVAKGELDLLRDQVLALRAALHDVEDVPQRKNTGSPAKSLSCCSDVTDSTLERMLLGSPVYSDDLDRYSTPTSRVVDDDVLLTIPDDSSIGNHVSIQVVNSKATDAAKTSQDDPAISISISPVSLKFQTEPKTSATVTSSPPPQKAPISPPTPKPTISRPFSVQHSTSVPTRLPTSPKPLTTLAHLQALMKTAHSGDESALTRVRAFCAAAHQTPRDQRTELQRFALINWRNRPRSASDPPQPPLSGDVNVEIYVDASAWGIGFVMDGQWLAWKFSDTVRHTAKPIDISWAEMLAVELGLWTTIHWATWQEQKGGQPVSLSILVRSDNAGVVKAVEKQYSGHLLQHDVLLRVLDLVEEYDIQLTMKWIASMENLADNPSRGVPGLNATLLSYVPPVPQHLADLLIPITNYV
ncbi:hypothetical protein AX14_009536 [Amanita brunnescens Koide BX004]|nr:hypothetical protein AX14_009536 [Amanita brunnescens Koide BX004]